MADWSMAQLGLLAMERSGMFTTSDAESVGIRRKQLTRMASNGAIERLAQGVYRMTGAPEHPHERVLAAWLAIGGHKGTPGEVPVAVAAGETAAELHGVGDFFAEEIDFIVQRRKATRLISVRLRMRHLQKNEVTYVQGVATLRIEKLIADLVDIHTDLSLVADALGEASRAGKITSRAKLQTYLAPLARRHGYRAGDGETFTQELFKMAGVEQ